MDNKGSHLPKHVAAVIPHAEEAEHFAVQLQELLELVKGRRSGVCAQGSRLLPTLSVGVHRQVLWYIHNDAFTFQKILKENCKSKLKYCDPVVCYLSWSDLLGAYKICCHTLRVRSLYGLRPLFVRLTSVYNT